MAIRSFWSKSAEQFISYFAPVGLREREGPLVNSFGFSRPVVDCWKKVPISISRGYHSMLKVNRTVLGIE